MLVLPLGITWFAAAVLALLDGRRCWVGWLGVVALSASFAAMVWLAAVVLRDGPLEMAAGGWPVGVGIRLRIDALGAVFALLALAVLLVALTYEVLGGVDSRTFPALVLFLATGLTGLFLTGDAFNFYVFFEVSMVAAFVLTSYGEQGRHIRATLMFVVVNLLGSVMFLGAIATLYHVTGTLDMQDIASQIRNVHPSAVMMIATIIFAAFGIKLGLFPFHYWLPMVYRDTRPVVAAILSGALASIGSYGLLRFGGEMLPTALAAGTVALLALGVASIVYGEILAIYRFPSSEVLAYSSIAQVGYILIALAIGGTLGFSAAVFYAVANALNKTVLFLCTGLHGWLTGAAFAIGALSVAGIPPSAGFFGKVVVLQATIAAPMPAIVAFVFLGGALSLMYMFQVYQRDFWAGRGIGPVDRFAPRALVLALAGVIVAVGLWPEPLLAFSREAAAVLTAGVQ